MKIAFFSTQSYDKAYFTRYNTHHELVFFEAPLNEKTVALADGCQRLRLPGRDPGRVEPGPSC